MIKIALKLHDKIFKQLQVQNKILEIELNFLEFIFGFFKWIKKYHEKNLSLLHQFYLIRNFAGLRTQPCIEHHFHTCKTFDVD